jgi:hypothetical protein
LGKKLIKKEITKNMMNQDQNQNQNQLHGTQAKPPTPPSARISEKSGSSPSAFSDPVESKSKCCAKSILLPLRGGGESDVISGALGRRSEVDGRSGLRGGIVGRVGVASCKKLGWFCIVVMGVPGRGGVVGGEWAVVPLPPWVKAVALGVLGLEWKLGSVQVKVVGTGLSMAITLLSYGDMLGGEGALRMRRRCLIDMLREEAALSGRGGGERTSVLFPLLEL